MPFLSEYYTIKKKLVNIFINDEKLISLIGNKDPDYLPASYMIEQMLDDGSMHHGQIHLYDYVPGESSTAESHVCIEITEDETETIYAGKFLIAIDIFVPECLMNMYGNIRRDAIAQRIDELINGEHVSLADLERIGGDLSKPIQGWRQRSLYYVTSGWNRSYEDRA